jgi:uncharacterized protein
MSMEIDTNILLETVSTPMPFGKYKGQMIANLPVNYLEWLHKKGFPKYRLGMLLSTVYEIKTNGLDDILQTLKKMS